MKESRIIRNLAAGAIILLLLLLISLLILLFQSRDYANLVSEKVGQLELSYDRDDFAKEREQISKSIVNCSTGLCLTNVKRADSVVNARLELYERLDLRTSDECLGTVTRMVDDPEESTVQKSDVLVSTVSVIPEDESGLEYRLRLLVGSRCYQADISALPINEITSETESRYLERRNLLTEQLLDIIASVNIKNYRTALLVEKVRMIQDEIFMSQKNSNRESPEPVKLQLPGSKVGEVVYESESTIVTFGGVVEDSRCPSEVECVQAGRLVVLLIVIDRQSNSRSELLLATDESATLENESVTLRIVSAMPERSINSEIDPDEYRVVINSKVTRPVSPEPKECVRGGCSGQLCVEDGAGSDVVTTCEFKEEYACYQSADCEVQSNGRCGFTQSDELTSCLEEANQN